MNDTHADRALAVVRRHNSARRGVVLVPQRRDAPRSPTGATLRGHRLSTPLTQEQIARPLGVARQQVESCKACRIDPYGYLTLLFR